MKLLNYLFAFVMIMPLFIDCEGDELDNAREATFVAYFLNEGDMFCNEAQLTFTFLITYPNGNQESVTLSPTEEYQKSLSLVRDGESINLKIFFPSSEAPIAEANIPFIFNGVSDEELEPPGNELLVAYCHNDDNGIYWNTFY